VALVGIALLAANLATVYSYLSLRSHVTAAAKERLARTAEHFGDLAGVAYMNAGGWNEESHELIVHLAQADGLAATVVDGRGRDVVVIPPAASPEEGAVVTAPVRIGMRTVGSVTVSQADGRLLTPVETRLAHELNRMHLAAGLTSAIVAVAVALYLAWTLSGSLRLIRGGAERMRAGDLDTRVKEGGDDEVRAVARALNDLAETLQQEESLRKESVDDLAHELRTPVMGLLARIEAAQDGVLDDEAANLAAMHDEATRLTRLLDDLSLLADAARPGLLLERTPVDLAAVADRRAGAVRQQFENKGIALSWEVEPVVVDGDFKRLEQIVANLLSNALRYTDPGGRVVVRVRLESGNAILEVADTGIGVAEGDVEHVFERFWRGEKSRSRTTGGAGIGLAIVKELVRAHGGQVSVDSAPGEGSTFRVTLPALR